MFWYSLPTNYPSHTAYSFPQASLTVNHFPHFICACLLLCVTYPTKGLTVFLRNQKLKHPFFLSKPPKLTCTHGVPHTFARLHVPIHGYRFLGCWLAKWLIGFWSHGCCMFSAGRKWYSRRVCVCAHKCVCCAWTDEAVCCLSVLVWVHPTESLMRLKLERQPFLTLLPSICYRSSQYCLLETSCSAFTGNIWCLTCRNTCFVLFIQWLLFGLSVHLSPQFSDTHTHGQS